MRHTERGAGRGLRQRNQTTGLEAWQGTQENRIDHGEDSGVRARAKRQRDHGDGGESFVVAQSAEGDPQVYDHAATVSLVALLSPRFPGRSDVGWNYLNRRRQIGSGRYLEGEPLSHWIVVHQRNRSNLRVDMGQGR